MENGDGSDRPRRVVRWWAVVIGVLAFIAAVVPLFVSTNEPSKNGKGMYECGSVVAREPQTTQAAKNACGNQHTRDVVIAVVLGIGSLALVVIGIRGHRPGEDESEIDEG